MQLELTTSYTDLNPLHHPSNNPLAVFGYGDIILLRHAATRVAHLVAEKVRGEILLGEAGAVGMAEVVVFEVDAERVLDLF